MSKASKVCSSLPSRVTCFRSCARDLHVAFVPHGGQSKSPHTKDRISFFRMRSDVAVQHVASDNLLGSAVAHADLNMNET